MRGGAIPQTSSGSPDGVREAYGRSSSRTGPRMPMMRSANTESHAARLSRAEATAAMGMRSAERDGPASRIGPLPGNRHAASALTRMPNALIPAIVFIGVAVLIVRAKPDDADAIGHTLTIVALVLGLLVTAALTAKVRAGLGLGRMMNRVEARPEAQPAGPARAPLTTSGSCHPCRERGLPPPPARRRTPA